MLTHDYTKALYCPECGGRLHGVKAPNTAQMEKHNPTGVVWVCQKAIGELAWDPEWRRQYYPPTSVHTGRLKWYMEARDPETPRWASGQLVPVDDLDLAA